jgi:L-asparaginase
MTILIAATGGTIASLPNPETGAVEPALSAESLVAGVPELARIDELEVVEIDRVNGWNVTPPTMLEVARTLAERLRAPEVRGAVVTHGTDTIEETAFLCDLLVAGDKPIAFAGAMRTGAETSADGPRNLICAARLAAAPEAAGAGAIVVLNDEAHAARWCVKTDSFRASAFASPGRGPVAHVTPDRLRVGALPVRFVVHPPERLPEVPVVKTFTGMAEGLIEAVVDATGGAGLVLEGTGAGNVPGSAMRGIEAAVARGLPVAIASRVATGGTVPIYGGPGGAVTARAAGALPAGALTAAKARLLLMVALGASTDAGAATGLFEAGVAALSPAAVD